MLIRLCLSPGMFNKAKDALSSRAARAWINQAIVRYGRVEHLQIDSRRKTIELCCLLEGETAPITVRVQHYLIEHEAGKKYLRATDFHCTRPWLQNLLMDFGAKRRFEVPGWAAAVL